MSLSFCLTFACAGEPKSPSVVAPAAASLPDAGVSSLDLAGGVTMCDVAATLLAAPRLEFGGLSAIERPEAARAKQADRRWVVALSQSGRLGGVGSTIDCGERLVLMPAAGPWPAGVEPFALRLRPRGTGAYLFTLVLGQQGLALASSEGLLERGEADEWRIVSASSRAPRPLDPTPLERTLESPLPAGEAQAWFEFDTGKDTLGARGFEPGLVLLVRWGTRELRQVFASCDDGAKGSALGDLEAGVLDLAGCGELYRLRQREADDGTQGARRRLVVEKQLAEGRWLPVVSLPVPTEVKKISNPTLARSVSNGG